jgi:hypothetical protein
MPRKTTNPTSIPETLPGTATVEQVFGVFKNVTSDIDIDTNDIIPLFRISGGMPDFRIRRSRKLSLAQGKLQAQHRIHVARKGAFCVVPRGVALLLIERSVAQLKDKHDKKRDSLVSAIQEAQMQLETHDRERSRYMRNLDRSVSYAKKSLPKAIKAYQE